MITYSIDNKNIYSKQIQELLRDFNESITGKFKFEEFYVYGLDNQQLVGAVKVHYFWDWVTIDDAFYLKQSILKEMIQEIWNNYKNKAVGIKLSTTVYNRLQDFLDAGFKFIGKVKPTENSIEYYYADLTNINYKIDKKHKIISDFKSIKIYQDIFNKHIKAFNKQNNILGKDGQLQIVALDEEEFIGGITCEIYDNILYISRIAVKKNYRNKQVGKNLMQLAESEAKNIKLEIVQLGTCDFQAKDFYEKLGYKIVFTRENNPKGFRSFMMIKIL